MHRYRTGLSGTDIFAPPLPVSHTYRTAGRELWVGRENYFPFRNSSFEAVQFETVRQSKGVLYIQAMNNPI